MGGFCSSLRKKKETIEVDGGLAAEVPAANPAITKQVLRRGVSANSPAINDEVEVHVVKSSAADLRKVFSTRELGLPLRLTLGNDKLYPGLDYEISSMKEGEVALFSSSAFHFVIELISLKTNEKAEVSSERSPEEAADKSEAAARSGFAAIRSRRSERGESSHSQQINKDDYTKFTILELKQELTKHDFGDKLLQLKNPTKKDFVALYEKFVLKKLP